MLKIRKTIKNGTLRVWHIRNGSVALGHQIEVESPIQAIALIEQWADEDLKNPNVEFNAFGLEVYDDTDLPEEDKGTEAGWSEWYNSDGEDIMVILDELEERIN